MQQHPSKLIGAKCTVFSEIYQEARRGKIIVHGKVNNVERRQGKSERESKREKTEIIWELIGTYFLVSRSMDLCRQPQSLAVVLNPATKHFRVLDAQRDIKIVCTKFQVQMIYQSEWQTDG